MTTARKFPMYKWWSQSMPDIARQTHLEECRSHQMDGSRYQLTFVGLLERYILKRFLVEGDSPRFSRLLSKRWIPPILAILMLLASVASAGGAAKVYTDFVQTEVYWHYGEGNNMRVGAMFSWSSRPSRWWRGDGLVAVFDDQQWVKKNEMIVLRLMLCSVWRIKWQFPQTRRHRIDDHGVAFLMLSLYIYI